MNQQTRKRPKNVKASAKRLFSYMGRHKILLIVVTILVTISASANLIGTYMLMPIIDKYADMSSPLFNELWKPILFEAVIYLFGVLSTLGYTQIMVYLAQKIVYEMRADLFNKMEKLPLSYFDSKTHGDIMSNYTNDIDAVSDTMNNAFAVLIQNMILIIGLLTIIFVLNWVLSVVCVVFYLIMTCYIVYAGKVSKRNFREQQKVMGVLNGFVEETLTGQKVVKVFNHEEANIAKFKEQNEALRKAGESALRYSFSMVPMVVGISYINYAVVAILGGLIAMYPILGINFSLGGMALYLVFVRQAAMPINQFTQQANLLLYGLAASERIFTVLDEIDEINLGQVKLVNIIKENDKIIKTDERTNMWAWEKLDGHLIELKGDVRFYKVDFSYDNNKMILENLSLYAKPGQKIAFVGSTGAGKTTITNLINRFYEINGGSITYDGIDIRNIRKEDLRRSLGIVLQDTHLFTGTIKDNIKYGKLDATDEEIYEAAKLANADSFIRRLPNGYDTMVTADGSNLSQGQRQLLAISRAAIANCPVLILDEATSSIDTHTEALVQKGMDRLMEGRTVFVIAHRLSTIKNANAIMVLEKGKIIERGDHQFLLSQKGVYYNLYTGKMELD